MVIISSEAFLDGFLVAFRIYDDESVSEGFRGDSAVNKMLHIAMCGLDR